jgi:Na+-transporting NADH:ubiquinone oxidoreductase subunit B
MAETKKKKPIIQKQKPMVQMILALIPVTIAAWYFYGWRALLVLAVVNIAGFFSEYVFARVYKTQVSYAVFVTNFLFALSLPPLIPLWIAVVGIVFGVVFGKMVFGGFGRNVFNPALSGRAFIYASFGVELSGRWFEPFTGFPGGFFQWAPDAVDAVTKATPLAILKETAEGTIEFMDMFLGSTSGSMGEASAVLIILAGIYLIYKKVASPYIIGSTLAGYIIMQAALFYTGLSVLDPFLSLFAGSLLFAFIFMATDPISSSQTTDTGRVIFGLLIGILTSIIRVFSNWPAAVTFAILLANTFAPLINHLVKQAQARAKVKKAAQKKVTA